MDYKEYVYMQVNGGKVIGIIERTVNGVVTFYKEITEREAALMMCAKELQ